MEEAEGKVMGKMEDKGEGEEQGTRNKDEGQCQGRSGRGKMRDKSE